jgi:hypothetical protein
MMTDEDRLRTLVVQELEIFIRAHGWDDEVLQEALLQVAKNHLWKKGLWVRLKVLFIILAAAGSFASMVAVVASLFGWESGK